MTTGYFSLQEIRTSPNIQNSSKRTSSSSIGVTILSISANFLEMERPISGLAMTWPLSMVGFLTTCQTLTGFDPVQEVSREKTQTTTERFESRIHFSKWLKSEFELSDLGKSGMHSHHLPYSSDFTQFPLDQRSRLPKSLCFIAADANNKRKGLDLLLDAVGHLHDPCEIHVIGEFNERMIGSIEHHRIVAHGYLSDPQKIASSSPR